MPLKEIPSSIGQPGTELSANEIQEFTKGSTPSSSRAAVQYLESCAEPHTRYEADHHKSERTIRLDLRY